MDAARGAAEKIADAVRDFFSGKPTTGAGQERSATTSSGTPSSGPQGLDPDRIGYLGSIPSGMKGIGSCGDGICGCRRLESIPAEPSPPPEDDRSLEAGSGRIVAVDSVSGNVVYSITGGIIAESGEGGGKSGESSYPGGAQQATTGPSTERRGEGEYRGEDRTPSAGGNGGVSGTTCNLENSQNCPQDCCVSNIGQACGNGGTIQCNGGCSRTCDSRQGQSCGSCGGTVRCDGSCSVSTPSNFGQSCGNQGTIRCDSSCSRTCDSRQGKSCGNCGTIDCSGNCINQGTCSPGQRSCSGDTTRVCTSNCQWQSEQNCNNFDRWTGGGNTQTATCGIADNDASSEFRDYGCSAGSCTYSATSTKDCDSQDGWYGGGNNAGCGTDPNSVWNDYYVIQNTGSCTSTTSCSGTGNVNCDSQDICTNRCEGNVFVSVPPMKDYYPVSNSNSCTSTADSPVREDCAAKQSTDTDGSPTAYTVSGTVSDYASCTLSGCSSNAYSDSCSANTLTEYGASGSSFTSSQYNCESLETNYCLNDKYYRNEYTCSGSPGACADAQDSYIGTNADNDAKDLQCGDSLCDNNPNFVDSNKQCDTGQTQCSSGKYQTCSNCAWQNSGTNADNDAKDKECGDSLCDNAAGVYDSTKTATENACTDSLDNDCDSLTDCSDNNCDGSIAGNVKNQNNQLVASADISAKKDLTTIKATATSSQGTYTLSPLNCGTYNLVASHPDYASRTKANIIVNPQQQTIANFEGADALVPGTSCEADCTYAADNIVHAACDSQNGCTFYDDVSKLVCDNSQPGWVRDYNTSHYVTCAPGSPQPKIEIEASVSCASGTLVKVTRIVVYNGKPTKLVVAACG